MDAPVATTFRRRNTPSADRLLGASYRTEASDGDEFNEDEVLWTGGFTAASKPTPHHNNLTSEGPPSCGPGNRIPISKGFGILAALPEDPDFSSPPSGRVIPTIPRRPRADRKASGSPARRQSAPVNVPLLSHAGRRNLQFDEIDDRDRDGEMLPPHEMVARSCVRSPMLACSVLEGMGRTLKGRDLRQVRNAVFRQTGLIDHGI